MYFSRRTEDTPHGMVCDSIAYAFEKSKPLDKRGDLYYILIIRK